MFNHEAKSTERTTYWMPFILYFLICGVLLVIFRLGALEIANYVAAAGLLVLAVTRIVHYFKQTPEEAAKQSFLTIGLIEACVAGLLSFNPGFLSVLLPVLFGLGMVTGGFEKLQVAVDKLRIHSDKWWILLIGAGVSFVTGALTIALFNEQHLIVGIFMIVEAAQDFFYLLVMTGKLPLFKGEITEKPDQAPIAPETPASDTPAAPAPEVPEYHSTAPVLFGDSKKDEGEIQK